VGQNRRPGTSPIDICTEYGVLCNLRVVAKHGDAEDLAKSRHTACEDLVEIESLAPYSTLQTVDGSNSGLGI
jgi:hypothetical protein